MPPVVGAASIPTAVRIAPSAASNPAIDRNNRDAALGSLAIAKRMLADGTNIWIAPEGTRSRTGELLPFKKGGFNLALEADLPILPVTLRGTRNDARQADGAPVRPAAAAEITEENLSEQFLGAVGELRHLPRREI